MKLPLRFQVENMLIAGFVRQSHLIAFSCIIVDRKLSHRTTRTGPPKNSITEFLFKFDDFLSFCFNFKMPFELISVNKPKFATNTQQNRFVDFFFYKLIYYVNNFFGRFHINIIQLFPRLSVACKRKNCLFDCVSCNVKAKEFEECLRETQRFKLVK